jgi:hypothetical protein
LQQVRNNLSKLTIDAGFAVRDQPFSVFLTKGLLEVSDGDNNNYFEFHPGSQHLLKEGLKKIRIDGPEQKQTLKIIEKAVSFLRRKFDRFKPDKREDDYMTMKKVLKVERNEYGIQKKKGKFILWKHGRGSIWKVLGTYTPNDDIAVVRWTFKFK